MCVIEEYFVMSKKILDIIGRSSSNDSTFRKDYNGWVGVVNYILFIRKCDVA